MKRIAIAIAGSLIGFSAFAANYDAAQPKTADFNNGELATYPAQVQGYDHVANVAVKAVGPVTEPDTELAAYPLVPTNDGTGTMMSQSRSYNERVSYRADGSVVRQ
jgi:hypothetical protein